MTSRIAVLAIDARDPARIADFWCQVLGWVVHERAPDGVVTIAAAGARPGTGDATIDVVSWVVLADPEGNEFCAFGPG
jgi:hypothetical protein